MNNNITIALALVAGLAGGLLTRYIAPPPVFAQTQSGPSETAQSPAVQAPAAKEVRAQSFTLIAENGDVAGTFTAEPTGAPEVFGPNNRRLRPQFRLAPMRIVLRDANGREIWSAGGAVVRPLAAASR